MRQSLNADSNNRGGSGKLDVPMRNGGSGFNIGGSSNSRRNEKAQYNMMLDGDADDEQMMPPPPTKNNSRGTERRESNSNSNMMNDSQLVGLIDSSSRDPMGASAAPQVGNQEEASPNKRSGMQRLSQYSNGNQQAKGDTQQYNSHGQFGNEMRFSDAQQIAAAARRTPMNISGPPLGNLNEMFSSSADDPKMSYANNANNQFQQNRAPLIAPGELIENFSKRSESSNRKYRAFKNFIHFLKQHNSSNPSGVGGKGDATVGGTSAAGGKNTMSTYMKPGGSSLFSTNTLKTVFKGNKDEGVAQQDVMPEGGVSDSGAARKGGDSQRSNAIQKRSSGLNREDSKQSLQKSEPGKEGKTTTAFQGQQAALGLDNITSSDVDDDFDDRYIHLIAAHSEINKAWGVLLPDQTMKALWDLVGLVAILYQSIVVPFRLCFNEEATGGFKVFETIIDITFMIDILFSFNTGFFRKGYLVMKRRDIVINYVKTWFVIDLIASFPYSWFFDMAGDSIDSSTDSTDYTSSTIDSTTGDSSAGGSNLFSRTPQLLRLIRIVRFLRFLRLLRVFKLKKLLYKFEEIIMSDTVNAILGFFKVIIVILFIAHWIACIFYYIGSSQLDSEPLCWLTIANMQDAATVDKYVISLYWAFTTMTTVGYGDVVPFTMSEKIYAIFSMLIACGVFAYVVGSIETIARRSNTMAAVFKEKILHVNQFLLHKQIPKYLRLKVRRYLEYMFEYKKQYKLSEVEVLNMLNENLKDQVIVHLNGRMLKNTQIFGVFDFRFLSEVTFLLANETFSMDDHIFEEEERGTKMYFITKGTVVIMQKSTHTYIKELLVDEYFGEVAFFSDLNRQATARSRGFTEVLSLNKESFRETAQQQQYPGAAKTYAQIHDKLTNPPHDYNVIFSTCYLCLKQGHISVHCEERFPEIKGNLQKQIQEMKANLKNDQSRKSMIVSKGTGVNGTDQAEDGGEMGIKDGVNRGGEAGEDGTEEFKTEEFLQTESDSGEEEGNSLKKQKSNGSSAFMMNALASGLGKKMGHISGSGQQFAGIRLNVNVFETAKKTQTTTPTVADENNTNNLLEKTGKIKKNAELTPASANEGEKQVKKKSTLEVPSQPQGKQAEKSKHLSDAHLPHISKNKLKAGEMSSFIDQDILSPYGHQTPSQQQSQIKRDETFKSAYFGKDKQDPHQQVSNQNLGVQTLHQRKTSQKQTSNARLDVFEDPSTQLHKQIHAIKEQKEKHLTSGIVEETKNHDQQVDIMGTASIPVKTKPQGILKKSQIASPIIEDIKNTHRETGSVGSFTPKQIRSIAQMSKEHMSHQQMKQPERNAFVNHTFNSYLGNELSKGFDNYFGSQIGHPLEAAFSNPVTNSLTQGVGVSGMLGQRRGTDKMMTQSKHLPIERINSFKEISKPKNSTNSLFAQQKKKMSAMQAPFNDTNSSHQSGNVRRSGTSQLLGAIKDPALRQSPLLRPKAGRAERNSIGTPGAAGIPPSDLGFGMLKDMINFEDAENEDDELYFEQNLPSHNTGTPKKNTKSNQYSGQSQRSHSEKGLVHEGNAHPISGGAFSSKGGPVGSSTLALPNNTGSGGISGEQLARKKETWINESSFKRMSKKPTNNSGNQP